MSVNYIIKMAVSVLAFQ